MRIKKKKQTRKSLEFYRINYGIRAPYKVLVDGTFVNASTKVKVSLREQLSSLLSDSVIPVVSNCIMRELRSLGHELIEAVVLAKRFFRHKCDHSSNDTANQTQDPLDSPNKKSSMHSNSPALSPDAENYLDARKCILDLIGNSNPFKYLVATQDVHLKNSLRKIPGVPLISMVGPGFILEPPSLISRDKQREMEDIKRDPLEWEKKQLTAFNNPETTIQDTRRRKKRKGKHPLSCLPKRKKILLNTRDAIKK